MLNIDCEYIFKHLDKDDHDFILNHQEVVIREELHRILGKLYIFIKNTIITKKLFNVTHIRVNQQRDVLKVEELISTIFSEEPFKKEFDKYLSHKKRNVSITISNYLSSHYGFVIVETLICKYCKNNK